MIKSIKLKNKAPVISFEREKTIGFTLSFCSGFMLSLARLFGAASPFAAAFAAAVSGIYSPFAAAGAVLGFMVRLDGAWSARQLAVVTAVTAVNFVTDKYTKINSRVFISRVLIIHYFLT